MQKINSRRDKERQKADDKGCSSQRRKKNCITEEFSKNRPKEFSSIDSLDMLYQQLKPTAKPSNEIETLLTTYFRKGFIYKEILDLFRERHDVIISMRTLKNKLKFLNLKRNKHVRTRFMQAYEVIANELNNSATSVTA